MKYQIGKRYETTVENFDKDLGMSDVGYQFECHNTDEDGNCWSMDVKYCGENCIDGSGWVAATKSDLRRGWVREVQ